MAALLYTLLAVLLFSSTQGLNAADQGSTLKLFRVNSPLRSQSTVSLLDTLLQTQSNDKARQQYLSSLVAGRRKVGVPIISSNTYVVEASIGTPPQKLRLAVDTSTDVGLVPCLGCNDVSCPHATFNTQKSSTFHRFHCFAEQCKLVSNSYCQNPACWFTTKYNDSTVEAELVYDNITLATYPVIKYTFGCALGVKGNSFLAQGLLGLGRGNLSLLSQWNGLSTFSYCLPSFKSSKSGSLILGNKQRSMIKTTPLLTNRKRPSLHIVKLVAILVDNKFIYIPRGGPSATVMDTGSVFTNIVWATYFRLRTHVRNLILKKNARVSKMGVFDTCYYNPITVPNITFMFDGMSMKLPPENIIIKVGSIYCLAMSPTPNNNVNSGLNIIASYQQQNFRVLINATSLGVVNENCS